MPFDDIVKTWDQLEKNSAKDHDKKDSASKDYLTQLNVVAGMFTRAADRVGKAEDHLSKLIAGYKLVVTELSSLEKELEALIKEGHSIKDGHVALMKGGVLGPLGKYRDEVEKNLADLVKDQKKL